MISRGRLLRTWHCKHGRLVAAYFSGSAMPRLAQETLFHANTCKFRKEDSKREGKQQRRSFRVTHGFAQDDIVGTALRGRGNSTSRQGEADPGTQRQKNYHRECNYFGRNWKSI
jgi:hypothetical protein